MEVVRALKDPPGEVDMEELEMERDGALERLLGINNLIKKEVEFGEFVYGTDFRETPQPRTLR